MFDLYITALRRLASIQERAAGHYADSGDFWERDRALRIARDSRAKADRLEAAWR